MKLDASIDLDQIETGTDWGETVAELIREELRTAIAKEICGLVKNDPSIKRAVNKAKKSAVEQIVKEFDK